jgi:hypothetical protein
MNRLVAVMTSACVLMLIGSFTWIQRSSVTVPAVTLPVAETQPTETHVEYAEEAQARDMVTITGPLADYMARRQPRTAATTETEPLQRAERKMTASDLVADSPIGTSNPILHKTFSVAKAANLPFEIPAHATNPQLRGTYSSFLQHAETTSSDEADVELLLLNERQYSDFLNQRPSDALFSAEGAHDQEVNVSMPPTFDHAVKYYLVFRNGATGAGRVAVQADFRVDF